MAGGRQREFDKEEALDKAMRVFWQKGYVGSSLSDLTSCMGINKPSLYATFGNKESLFIQATERYMEVYSKRLVAHLEQPDQPLKQRVKDYITAIVEMQCDKSNPSGCYLAMCNSETAGDGIPKKALETIKKAGSYSETFLIKYFEKEIEQGKLASEPGSEVISLYLLTMLNGISSIARSGKKQEEIERMICYAVNRINWYE